jgi:hypothetical protein
VCALVLTDRRPRCIATYTIDRAMIIACTSQTELDLPNQRVSVSSAALVNRWIVRIVSVIVRIISGIVSVIRIGIVKEGVKKIVKEDKAIVEVAMVEPMAAKATAKSAITKATAKAATVKAACTEGAAAVKPAASKPAAKASSSTEAAATKAAPVTAPATAVRHHV